MSARRTSIIRYNHRTSAPHAQLSQPGFHKRALDGYVILVPLRARYAAAPKPRRGHDVVPRSGPPQAA
eukprot:scaffold74626_cov65-Phaeocystis_antarctica.AAC.1